MAIEKPIRTQSLPTMEIDQDVWELAVQRARQMYEMFDTVAVSFSGGKDSTATLHAVLAAAHEKPEERLPVRVIFWDEECIPQETVDYVRRVSQRDDVNLEWYCLPIQCGNATRRDFPYWYPWAPEDKHKWVRELPPEAITTFPGYDSDNWENRVSHHELAARLFHPEKDGDVVLALGIRAAESLRRRQAVTRREEDNWLIPIREPGMTTAQYKAYPIYDWGDDDVWTAPKLFNWDYNRSYDHMEMHGVARSAQRVGPPFGQEPMGGLNIWAACYPDIWDKMVYRVPGAATAARYSRTGLYQFREEPKKPEGQTWREFIKHQLTKRSPAEAESLAHRIDQYIKLHYKETGGMPISEKDYHPQTGASWTFLARIVMRGDRMGRKHPADRRALTEKDYNRQLEKYNKEIKQIKAEGRLKEII